MKPWVGRIATGVLLAAFALGCATVRSRRHYAEVLTAVGCDRYAQCGRIGAGKEFETREQCETQVLWAMYDYWPETECDGQINETRFEYCQQRASAAACEGSFTDAVRAFVECSKERLCVDRRYERQILPHQLANRQR